MHRCLIFKKKFSEFEPKKIVGHLIIKFKGCKKDFDPVYTKELLERNLATYLRRNMKAVVAVGGCNSGENRVRRSTTDTTTIEIAVSVPYR